MTILEALTDLPPALLRAASHLIVTPWDDTHATLTVSIAIMLPGVPARRDAGPYAVTVDSADLPDGIALTGWTRYPDQVRTITIITSVRDQLATVHAAGIVGTLDVALMEAAAPGYPRWHVTTHAGSQAERLAWLRSLPSSFAIPARSWTTEQAAAELQITPGRVRQLAAELGVGGHTGRDWRFSDEDMAVLRARATKRGPKGPRSGGRP